MGEQVAARFIWGCSSVGRAPALQAGGQEFESLHLHWCLNIAAQKLRFFARVQARYKIEYPDRLMKASFQRRPKYPILQCTLKTAY